MSYVYIHNTLQDNYDIVDVYHIINNKYKYPIYIQFQSIETVVHPYPESSLQGVLTWSTNVVATKTAVML